MKPIRVFGEQTRVFFQSHPFEKLYGHLLVFSFLCNNHAVFSRHIVGHSNGISVLVLFRFLYKGSRNETNICPERFQ